MMHTPTHSGQEERQVPKVMPMIRYLSVAVGLVLIAGCGGTQPFQQTIDFDCDVPPGNITDWTGTLPPRLAHVGGEIELVEPRTHAQWLPVASVLLARDEEQVGLQLVVLAGSPNDVQISAVRPKSSGGSVVLATLPWKGNHFRFAMRRTDAGDVTMSVGGKEISLGVTEFEAERILMSCSSSEFTFGNVEISAGGS